MKKEKLNVAIDCRMIESSGIGTFLNGILPYLLKNKSINYKLFGQPHTLNSFKTENSEIVPCDIPIFSLREIIGFPRKYLRDCDLFFTPNYNIPGFISIPIYATIHDLLFLDVPELKGFIGRFIRKIAALRAIKISKILFTVSNFSESRIKYYFPKTKNIYVCYNGTDNFNVTDISKPNLSITEESYFLYVGNIKPHKGLRTLLNAFKKRKEEGEVRRLIIVGNQSDFKTKDENIIETIKSLGLEKEVIFTGYVPQSNLVWLMKNASCLIQPSTYEGFGLPPLEALHLGTPVILSDIPVFKEIYSDFPVTYFTANDYNSLADEMKKKPSRIILNDKQKEKYSYRRSADIIINKIREYKQL